MYILCPNKLEDNKTSSANIGEMFKTDLFKAITNRNLKKVKSVLKKRPDAIHTTKNGDSPLHVATTMGFTEIMELLIQHGSNVNKINNAGLTPLHIACSNSHYDSVLVLREHDADPSIPCRLGNTSLHEVARTGNTRILKFLFQYGFDINLRNDDGWTALHRAVYSNHEDAVHVLCAQGIDVAIRNNADKTAGEVAVQFMYYNLSEIIRNFEKKPDFQNLQTTQKDTTEAMTGKTGDLKIEHIIEQGRESIKSLFTWKTPPPENDGTRDTVDGTASDASAKMVEDNKQGISFFTQTKDKFLNFTSQMNNNETRQKSEDKIEDQTGQNSSAEDSPPKTTNTENEADSPEPKQENKPILNEKVPSAIPTEKKNVSRQEDKEEENEQDDNDEELHECPVCLEVPLPPLHVYQCQNGHLYCGNCKNMPNMFNCPQCGVDIASASSRNRYAEEIIARIYKDKKPS